MIKVYVELIFLDNFAMNFILLALCAALLNVKTNWPRLSAGAAAGGLYACFMFAYGGLLSFIPMKIALSALICLISFYKKGNLKTFAKSIVCLYVCTFAAGGVIYALLQTSGSDYSLRGGIIVGTPVYRYALGGALLTIVLFALFRRAYAVKLKKGFTYELKITLLGKEATCRAYLDTGNGLKEPLSGLPVIIVEKEALLPLLPPEMADALLYGRESAGEGEPWRTRIRLLPCTGIAGRKNALLGFKPDSVKILEKGGEREVMAIIGVTGETLNDAGLYHALLGPQVLV